jgi:hypothetical protein
MFRTILEHKPLILDVQYVDDLEEMNWLLGELPKAGLCFNARLDPSAFDAVPDLPGSSRWILDDIP